MCKNLKKHKKFGRSTILFPTSIVCLAHILGRPKYSTRYRRSVYFANSRCFVTGATDEAHVNIIGVDGADLGRLRVTTEEVARKYYQKSLEQGSAGVSLSGGIGGAVGGGIGGAGGGAMGGGIGGGGAGVMVREYERMTQVVRTPGISREPKPPRPCASEQNRGGADSSTTEVGRGVLKNCSANDV